MRTDAGVMIGKCEMPSVGVRAHLGFSVMTPSTRANGSEPLILRDK